MFTSPGYFLLSILMLPMKRTRHILHFRYGWATFEFRDFCFYSSFALSSFSELFFPAARRYLSSHRTEPFVYEGDEEGTFFKLHLTPNLCYAYRYHDMGESELVTAEWRYPCNDLDFLEQLLADIRFYSRDLVREDTIFERAKIGKTKREARRLCLEYVLSEVDALYELIQHERAFSAASGESAASR